VQRAAGVLCKDDEGASACKSRSGWRAPGLASCRPRQVSPGRAVELRVLLSVDDWRAAGQGERATAAGIAVRFAEEEDEDARRGARTWS
jgi:hypothetical protein